MATISAGAAVVASGMLMCILWAPKTTRQPLGEASSTTSPITERNRSDIS